MRLRATFLCLLVAGGCREVDDELFILGIIPGTLSLTMKGGQASNPTGAAGGSGGIGGTFDARSDTDVFVGVEPAWNPPPLPAVPNSGVDVATLGFPAPTANGTIIVGSLTTSGGSPVTITSNFGDVVVSGTLLAEDLGGARGCHHQRPERDDLRDGFDPDSRRRRDPERRQRRHRDSHRCAGGSDGNDRCLGRREYRRAGRGGGGR